MGRIFGPNVSVIEKAKLVIEEKKLDLDTERVDIERDKLEFEENKRAIERRTKALEFFKDWTNYLLVTTVVAVGWIATTKDAELFSNKYMRAVCILSLAASIVFAIFTLALIPLVQERRGAGESNYQVNVDYWLFGVWHCRLKTVCFPQYVFFILGVMIFALGTALRLKDDQDIYSGITAERLTFWAVAIVTLATGVVCLWNQTRRRWLAVAVWIVLWALAVTYWLELAPPDLWQRLGWPK
jgi:nitrate reductase gamma subunit